MTQRNFQQLINQAIQFLSDGFSRLWVRFHRHDREEYLKDKRKQRTRFEKRLQARWGSALDPLEQFIHVNIETGRRDGSKP